MCGIVAYIGRDCALPKLLSGLRRLEYRGYDSAGVAVIEKLGNGRRVRAEGRLDNLEKALAPGEELQGTIGIAHTRWATHGVASAQNAHPHVDCTNSIYVVHNGTLDNHSDLRQALVDLGHRFESQTDTEIIPHLIEEYMKYWGGSMPFEDVVRLALHQVRGTLAIAVMYSGEPDKIVLANKGANLVIGVASDAMFAASDVVGFLEHTRENVHLDSGEMAVLTRDSYKIQGLNGDHIEREPRLITWTLEEAELGPYPSFLLKEIFGGPYAVENVLRGHLIEEEGNVRLGGLDAIADELVGIKRVCIIGSGTSLYAAEIGRAMLLAYAGVPTEAILSSMFCDMPPVVGSETCVIAISQSGTTKDTEIALCEAKLRGAKVMAVINVVDSPIARLAGRGVYTHSGPEISVASTKVFDAQIVALALIALWFGRRHGLSASEGQRIIKALTGLPGKMRRVLAQEHRIKEIAESYALHDNMLFLGRGPDWHIALEGALKMKELSYIHAEGCEAAQMKHGVIALISPQCPCVVVATAPSVRAKVISNISEIRARDGKVLAIALEGDKEVAELASDTIFVPWAEEELLQPVLVAPVMQLFAGYMAMYRGCDVDHPRNLAKSVTV